MGDPAAAGLPQRQPCPYPAVRVHHTATAAISLVRSRVSWAMAQCATSARSLTAAASGGRCSTRGAVSLRTAAQQTAARCCARRCASSWRRRRCGRWVCRLHVRAVCVRATRTSVRDQFYTGDIRRERASVITRIAQTFIRFGSFEVCKRRDPRTGASGPCVGKPQVIRQLMDYVSSGFFAEAEAQYQKQLAECDQRRRQRARPENSATCACTARVVRRTARDDSAVAVLRVSFMA